MFLARGIEDDHYWVVEDFDWALVETPWPSVRTGSRSATRIAQPKPHESSL